MSDTEKPADKPALTPANENPWYCLMTLHGEQPADAQPWSFDKDLHARNRRDWNRWASRALDETARKTLLEARDSEGNQKFSEDELTSHSAEEWARLAAAFKKRVKGSSIKGLPDPGKTIALSQTHFERFFCATGLLFPTDADLSSATFSGTADLSRATFSGNAFLSGATFSGYAYLRSATFSGNADLSSATFSSDAYLRSATFSGHANFSNVTFKGAVSFEKAKFETVPPNFHESSLHSDTNWLDAEWPKPPAYRDDAARHVRYYQRLKQIMESLKKHEDELDFFAREMAAQRVVDGGLKTPRGFLNGLYALTSDYGRKVNLPLAWLAVVIWAGFALIVWTGECSLNEAKICLPDAEWRSLGIGKALALSLTSAVGFLPLKKEIFGDVGAAFSATAHFIMSVEAIISAILLFLAGLGLRNRFRMK